MRKKQEPYIEKELMTETILSEKKISCNHIHKDIVALQQLATLEEHRIRCTTCKKWLSLKKSRTVKPRTDETQ